MAELLPTHTASAHRGFNPHRQRADPAGAEPLIAHGLERPSPIATIPTLPSVRTLALSMNHILAPGVVTFTCPEGHFWFQKPDLDLSLRPYEPDADVFCDFAHAPCPTTRRRRSGCATSST